MAASLKIPTSLKRKATKRTQSCQSSSENFSKKKRSWVALRLDPYTYKKIQRKTRKVVTKKNNVNRDSKSRFVKEAALLNSTKGHRNIIRFLGFCEDPYSIMKEGILASIFARLELQKAFAL
jgi:hypothetical protein